MSNSVPTEFFEGFQEWARRAQVSEAALARVEALQREWWLSDDPEVEKRADALREAIDGD